MKYSVIVPVYKAESTIEKCLQSMLSQTHNGVEILLINDGSPDRSGEICEKYAAEYECVRYFSKENGGVSSARNMGLDNATGEYILFVDSDDYVADNYFKVIDSVLCLKRSDLMMYKLRKADEVVHEKTDGIRSIESNNYAAELAAELRKGTMYSLCTKAFRRELIEKSKLRFEEGQYIAEDLQFIFSYLMTVKTAELTDEALYIVSVENGDSLSRKKRTDLAEQLLNADMGMLAALKAADMPEEDKSHYRSALAWLYYRSVYSACKELLKFKMSGRERRKKIREICRLYKSKNVKPLGKKCWIFAIPVRLKLTLVIDCMAKYAARGK